jgi:chaperonin GroES
MAQLIPMNNFVIVKRLDVERVTKGGIIIPDISLEKSTRGAVICSGPGLRFSSGYVAPTGVDTNDVVYFGAYKGTEIEVEGELLLVLRAEDILCVEKREAA